MKEIEEHWFKESTDSERALAQREHWLRGSTGSEREHWLRVNTGRSLARREGLGTYRLEKLAKLR